MRPVRLTACLLWVLLGGLSCCRATNAEEEPGRVWRFVRLGEGLPTTGQWRSGFDLADLDDDGILDLVHGPARGADGRPVIFRGDGRGGFRAWSEARFPELPYDYGDVAAGDFNGDGQLDLAFGTHLGDIHIVSGQGRGSFTATETGAVLMGFATRAVEVADWNGDGRLDLLALGEGPQPGKVSTLSRGLAIFLNRPQGWLRSTVVGNAFGDALAVGEFNGDRKPDVVTASRVLGLSSVVHLGSDRSQPDTVELDSLPPSGYLTAVASADFDGDGRDDLAIAALSRSGHGPWTGSLHVTHVRSPYKLESFAVDDAETAGTYRALAAGDLDGDGAADLVASDAEGAVHLWRNTKQRMERVQVAELTEAGHGCRGSHLRIADLDRDGEPEIVASFADEGCESGGSLQVWRRATGVESPASPAPEGL